MSRSTLIILLAGLIATTALADETVDTNYFKMGEIVVTADRIPAVELAGTSRIISAEELEQSGAQNLGDALTMMPGVYNRTGNDGVQRIDIRGFRSRHVTLLLNGVPMNSTYDGQFDPALIPVENIAKVKVGYGNQSVLYGSGGLGGVINVITKSGEPGTHGSLTGEIGEGQRYIGRATFSQSSENVDFFVGASHAEQDHYKLSDDFDETEQQDDDERHNSDYKRDNLLSSLSVDLNDDWQFGVVGNYMHGEYGKPQSIYPRDDFSSNTKYERVDSYTGYGGQATLARELEGGVNVRSAFFYNELKEKTVNYDDASYDSVSDNQLDHMYTYGANVQVGRPFWTGFEATLAAHFKSDKYKSDLTNPNDNVSATVLNGMIGMEVQQALDGLVLVGGYSQNWQQNNEYRTDAEGSYMTGATYDLFDSTMLHASYAHQIRFPSIKQLYDPKSGNPNLSVEKSDNYEAGVTQGLGDRTEVDITGFLRDVDDYIERPDNNSPNENYEKYLFKGIETTLNSSLTDSLDVFAGYTFMHTKDRSSDSDKDELQYRPRHNIQVGADWTFFTRFSLYGSVQYVDGQHYYSRTNPTQKARLDSYTLVNMRLSYQVLQACSIYGGVDNLFDKDYSQSYGMPREGRMFYAGTQLIF